MSNPKPSLNLPVPGPDDAVFGLKFHQVAIYCADMQRAILEWTVMGYSRWHYDEAVLVGLDRGELSRKQARMAFNYDIMPLELEYVSYMGPRNSQDSRDGSSPFISHLSTMVEDVDEKCAQLMMDFGIAPYHQFVTEQHSNPNVAGKKRFKEAIFDTAAMLGFDIKLIQRVPWDYGQEAEAQG